MLLFTADGDTLPQFRPGIQQLRDHMSDLNEQIVVFHGLTITAEEMLQIETRPGRKICVKGEKL